MEARAHLALAATVVAWAGAFPAIKALLDSGIAAQDVALVRYAIAAPGFALLLVLAGGLPGIGRRGALRLALAGVLVVAGYHLSLNGSRSSSSTAAARRSSRSQGSRGLRSSCSRRSRSRSTTSS